MIDIISYVIALMWGLCLLCSLVGWGRFVGRVLLPVQDHGWGQHAAWGVSFSVLIGGILNLSWAISRVTIVCYVLAGILCFFLLGYRSLIDVIGRMPARIFASWCSDKPLFLSFSFLFIATAVYYVRWVVTPQFSFDDDFHAYLVFPQKMLGQGALGIDYFSDRRVGVLGGHAFLQSLVMGFGSLKNVRMIDPGIATIILVGLLWGIAKESGLSYRMICFVMAVILLVTPPVVNSSSLVMGVVLFVALIHFCRHKDGLNQKDILARAIIIAMLMAALCALKSIFVVSCLLYFIFIYICRWTISSQRKDVVLEGLIASVLTGVFLFPWMMASYQASGTLLYPLLGRGYHYSAYGHMETKMPDFKGMLSFAGNFFYSATTLLMVFLILINTMIVSLFRRFESIVVGASAVISIFLLSLVLQPVRYGYSFYVASFLMILLYGLSSREGLKRSLLRKVVIVIVICFIPALVSRYSSDIKNNVVLGVLKGWGSDFIKRLSKPLCPPKKQASILKAQQAVPPGAFIVECLAYPFVLDFKRNPILIVDYPSFGPKPGMPILKGGEEIARYFLTQGIRYVMYSYRDEAGLSKKTLLKRMDRRESWVKVQSRFILAFHDALIEMGRTKRRIYDDGYVFVLDLANK